MDTIKIAIVGIGNCASSLIQGIEYYKRKDSNDAIGLMHWDIGGHKPYDIEIVAAFDIDKKRSGKMSPRPYLNYQTAPLYSARIYSRQVLR